MQTDPNDPYVETRYGNIYVRGHRVTLESIARLWLEGEKPEAILADFPTISLASVYGTIAYYLSHQEEMDRFLAETKALSAARRAADEAANPEWYAKMRQRMAEA